MVNSTTRARGNTLRIQTQQNRGIVRIILVAGVGIIGVALLVKLIAKGRKVSSSNRAAEDPNVQMAMLLNSAINPARSWVGGIFTGANVDEIMRLAYQIKNYEDVSREYNNLYGEALSLELQDALGSQYPTFQRIIGGGVMSDQEANNLVIELYNQIDGWNWTGKETVPFETLKSLANEDFKKVVTMYNSKYSTNFIEDLKAESSTSITGLSLSGVTPSEWKNIVAQLVDRYNTVF